MTEKQRFTNHESSRVFEKSHHAENHNSYHKAEHLRHEQPKDTLETARAKVAEHSKSIEAHKNSHDRDEATPQEQHRHYITSKVKLGAFNNVMSDTRSKLGKRDALASKIIHNGAVEQASELASKTIARPNQMLTAGLLMVIVGLVALMLAKRYGFELPLSVFIAIYIITYALSLLFELLFKKLIPKKRNNAS